MDAVSLVLTRLDLYWLIAARVAGMLMVAPVFGTRFIPVAAKIGLVLFTSLILLPLVPVPAGGIPAGIWGFLEWEVRELVLGLAIGYLSLVLFAAVQLAGQLLDNELGFSIGQVLDPLNSLPVPMVASFLYALALLLFLVLNGHYYLLAALQDSFRAVPPGGFHPAAGSYELVIGLTGWMFRLALELVLPALIFLFLSTVVLGILARVVPQLNVFMVGFPLKILVGLLALAVFLPGFAGILRGLFPDLQRTILTFLGQV